MRRPEIECIALVAIILGLLIWGLMEKAEHNREVKTLEQLHDLRR